MVKGRKVARRPKASRTEGTEAVRLQKRSPVHDLVSYIEDALADTNVKKAAGPEIWSAQIDQLFVEIVQAESLQIWEKREIFTQIQRALDNRSFALWPPIPDVAPLLWSERIERLITPVEFVRKYYGTVLGAGLSQADIRRLDPNLYTALHNWKRRHGWDESFDLPSKKRLNDTRVEMLDEQERQLSTRLADAVRNRRRTTR